MKIVYALDPARDLLLNDPSNRGCRLFAEDIHDDRHMSLVRSEGTRIRTAGAKRYLVASIFEIFQRCSQFNNPHIYEVIDHNLAARLYFDMERERTDEAPTLPPDSGLDQGEFNAVNAADITPVLATLVQGFIHRAIMAFLSLAFPSRSFPSDSIILLSACTPQKLSFHVLVTSILLDYNVTSCAAVAWEFSLFFDHKVREILRRPNITSANREMFLRLVNMHPNAPFSGGFIDPSVYSKSQCFRLLGNSKVGKAPLRIGSNSAPFWRGADEVWSFSNIVHSPEDLTRTLVNPAAVEQEVICVHVLKSFPWPSAWSWSKRNAPISEDAISHEARFSVKHNILRNGGGSHSQGTGRALVRGPQTRNTDFEPHKLRILDDTYLLFDEHTNARAFKNFEDSDVVFDPFCEVANGEPIGTPSAHIYVDPKDGIKRFFCFNCNANVFCLPTWEPLSLEYGPEDVIDPPSKKINFEGRVDIDLEIDGPKMKVIDAPTGSGKTELLASFAARYPEASILAISFRTGLACSLASRLKITDYKEEGIWDDPVKRRRVSLCLNSLVRVWQGDTYDIILIDECGMVRRHFITEIVSPLSDSIQRILTRLLSRARSVVLAQYQILETDVEFWGTLAGIDIQDRTQCRRWVYPAPAWLHPMWYTDDLTWMVLQMRDFYVENYDVDASKMRAPFVVFTSRATHAKMFTQFLQKHVAPSPVAASRIRGVWGAVTEHAWARQFLANPNAVAPDCDVLVVTPVLQAGHSIDGWFVTSFCFFTLSALTTRDEVQFGNRLREHFRLLKNRFAYIQKGISGGELACEIQLAKSCDRLTADDSEQNQISSALLRKTTAEAFAELAHTKNTHEYSWVKLYEGRPQDMWRLSELVRTGKIPPRDEEQYRSINMQIKDVSSSKGTMENIVLSFARLLKDDAEYVLDVLDQEEPVIWFTDLLKLEARVMIRDIKDHIRASAYTEVNILTVLIKQIPNLSDYNQVGSALGKAYCLGAYLDLLCKKRGNAQLWDHRWRLARTIPARMASLVLLEMLYDVQELLHNNAEVDGGDVDVEERQFRGFFTGIWPAKTITDQDMPAIREICGRNEDAWRIVKRKNWSHILYRQNTPLQHLKTLLHRIGSCSKQARDWKRGPARRGQGKGTTLDLGRVRQTLTTLRALLSDWHWSIYREELGRDWGSLLDEAVTPYVREEVIVEEIEEIRDDEDDIADESNE